jgi:hypothetical protein
MIGPRCGDALHGSRALHPAVPALLRPSEHPCCTPRCRPELRILRLIHDLAACQPHVDSAKPHQLPMPWVLAPWTG